MEQRLTNIERSDRCSKRKCSVETQELPKRFQAFVIELPMEPPTLLFTLLPAEQATKPAPQFTMEPTSPQSSPLASEPFTPHVARVAKRAPLRCSYQTSCCWANWLPLTSRLVFDLRSPRPLSSSHHSMLFDPHYFSPRWPMGAFGPRLNLIKQLSLFRR